MFATALFLLQATFQAPRLVESSGVAVSRAYPGVLWTHNDSGDGPYLYATDLRGTDRGALLVSGAQALDWEDISLGPCPVAFPLQTSSRLSRSNAPSCVYLADTGDNLEVRPFVTVYAVAEPPPPERASDTLATTRAAAVLQLRYPDGPHDVEAVYVSPRDTALYLVSKGATGGSAIRLYRVDRGAWRTSDTTGNVVVATLVQTLDIRPNREAGRVVTAGAIRSDGRIVAIRTYSEIYLFYPGVGGRLLPARERPCNIARREIGGEAIDFLDDSTFVLTSEASGRRPGTIDTVKCGLLREQSNQ
ncbi:MAG TPA: hypothetical protein VGQ29_06730 [Gemmatimonadales bacterium]|nr:hypothetical protein [Gemmatimonadales bacterium]